MKLTLPSRAFWANRSLYVNGIVTLLLAGEVCMLNARYGLVALALVILVLVYCLKGDVRNVRFDDEGMHYNESATPFKIEWGQIAKVTYSIKGYEAGWGDLIIALRNGSAMVLSLDDLIATRRTHICYDEHIEKPLAALCEGHGVRFERE